MTSEEDKQSTPSSEGKHATQAQKAYATARSHRWLRIVLVVVGIILVIALVVVAALGAFVNSGKDELLADNTTSSLRKNLHHDGQNYVFNENMITVALIGTDRGTGSSNVDGSGNADAIIMVALNTETGRITLINVPRNVVLTFPFEFSDGTPGTSNNFISAAYAFGKDDAQGAEFVCGALTELFRGIPVENYVAMLEGSIGPITDAMGGVKLTAIESVDYMGIKAGETYTLKGEQALRYVQFRDITKMTSPIDRIERQKDFIKAFIPQTIAAAKKDPSILGKLYDIVTDPQYMTTNLNLNELAYLASTVMINGVGDFDMRTVECDEEYKSQLLWYYPKEEQLFDLLLDVYYLPVEHF